MADHVTFPHIDGGESAHAVSAYVDVIAGFDFPGRRDDRDQILSGNLARLDPNNPSLEIGVNAPADACCGGETNGPQNNLFAAAHALLN